MRRLDPRVVEGVRSSFTIASQQQAIEELILNSRWNYINAVPLILLLLKALMPVLTQLISQWTPAVVLSKLGTMVSAQRFLLHHVLISSGRKRDGQR